MATIAVVHKKGDFDGAVIEVYESFRDAVSGYMIEGLSRSRAESGSCLTFRKEDCQFITVDVKPKEHDFDYPLNPS